MNVRVNQAQAINQHWPVSPSPFRLQTVGESPYHGFRGTFLTYASSSCAEICTWCLTFPLYVDNQTPDQSANDPA